MKTVSREEQVAAVKKKYEAIAAYLNERSRRLWAGSEAQGLGHGGQTVVHLATGLAIGTISQGRREVGLGEADRVESRRLRRAGGGRKSKLAVNKPLAGALETILN